MLKRFGFGTEVLLRFFVVVIMAVLMLNNLVQGGANVVVNGSFEYDGRIDNIIMEKAPQRWFCDVNFPSDNFGGWVKNDWSTYVDNGYSLTLYSKESKSVKVGDVAIVSQQVYLQDVNEILFDIKLGTEWSDIDWDPEKRSAILLIDTNVVWNSNVLGPDATGEYRNLWVDVNGLYDAEPHTLSLAIRADVNETSLWQYWAQWDFVRFDTYCEGFGYLPQDLNLDCYVDMLDLKMLTEQWLEELPAEKYDLFQDEDDIINFPDFAIFAEAWTGDSFGYEQEDGLLAMDLNNDGIVNFLDFAILTRDSGEEVDYIGISRLAGEWLLESWLYRLE